LAGWLGSRRGVGAAFAQAVALALEGDHRGVVNEAVDERGGDHGVAEDLAPGLEAAVAGDDDRAAFVAARDEREEQVGGLALQGEVADLVDDQQPVAFEAAQFVVEVVAVLGGFQAGDPLLGGRERDAVAGLAGLDRQRGCEVGLAGAGRVGVELLMLLIRCRSVCGWWPRLVGCGGSNSRFWGGGRRMLRRR
jgi:hypothetical protein